MTDLSYALVTPARNEEAYIEQALQSVIRQTKRPIRWIIVSNGSTDRTDQFVRTYSELHPWIELIPLPDQEARGFAAKARAFNTGYQKLGEIECDVIGNLDADVSFDEGYFAFLLGKFAEMPELGVAGTPFVEDDDHYDYRYTNIEHVSGACQLFRRECLREVGGYAAVQGGGIDWIAVTTARMKGWKTRTFVEKVCFHHRKMGSARGGSLKVWFRRGQEDYAMGNHLFWQLARSSYQVMARPYLLGGLLLFSGYVYECARGTKRPISDALVQFCREEQMARLRHAARRLLSMGKLGERIEHVQWVAEREHRTGGKMGGNS